MKKTIIGILVFSLFLLGCKQECPNCMEQITEENCVNNDVCPLPEEKGMVSVFFGGWGENIETNNEYILRYSVYNYGLVEAKNVTAKCYIEKYGNVVEQKEENIGNIGSTSVTFKEMYIKSTLNMEDSFGLCYLKSCDGCVILDDRIKDNEQYKK